MKGVSNSITVELHIKKEDKCIASHRRTWAILNVKLRDYCYADLAQYCGVILYLGITLYSTAQESEHMKQKSTETTVRRVQFDYGRGGR